MSGDLTDLPDVTEPESRSRPGPGAPQWGSALGLTESLDELAERFATLCANAVDALEIAAGLEMDGMSDQSARVDYGCPDVFAVAEQLYRRTQRRPADVAATPNPWHTTVGRHALHGLLFAMPALCYPVAAGFLTDRHALILLVISMLVSWPASQGLSYLGHARRSGGDEDGARWLLRAGLGTFGLLLVAVVALTATVLREPLPTSLFAAGQGGYLLAATVLLVANAELWLCVALAPGVLGSAVYLLLGRLAGLHEPAWLALGATLLLATAFALARTSRPRPKPARRMVRAGELRAAAPSAAFGLLVICLLVFPLVAPRLLAVSAHGTDTAAVLGTLPLSLSMGAAELQLYRYRGRIFGLLHRAGRLEEFAGRSRWVLVGTLGEYLVAAAVLMAAVVGLSRLAGFDPQWSDMPGYAGYLALGCALFVALLTQTCTGTGAVLVLCAAALCAEFAVGFADPHALLTRIQLLCATGLLVALLANAGLVLGRANEHGH